MNGTELEQVLERLPESQEEPAAQPAESVAA
jgi:hypothetical protein